MENSLTLELHIFLTSIYGGIIGGLVYDLYRTIRYHYKLSKFITYIQDFLFWIVMTYIFFSILIKINWGEIRGYIILGFIIGLIIYIITFSKFVYPLAIKLVGLIRNTMRSIIGLIRGPFKYIKKKRYPSLKKIRKLPIEMVKEGKRYRKIIFSKK